MSSCGQRPRMSGGTRPATCAASAVPSPALKPPTSADTPSGTPPLPHYWHPRADATRPDERPPPAPVRPGTRTAGLGPRGQGDLATPSGRSPAAGSGDPRARPRPARHRRHVNSPGSVVLSCRCARPAGRSRDLPSSGQGRKLLYLANAADAATRWIWGQVSNPAPVGDGQRACARPCPWCARPRRSAGRERDRVLHLAAGEAMGPAPRAPLTTSRRSPRRAGAGSPPGARRAYR
jgi:hypothetical protein